MEPDESDDELCEFSIDRQELDYLCDRIKKGSLGKRADDFERTQGLLRKERRWRLHSDHYWAIEDDYRLLRQSFSAISDEGSAPLSVTPVHPPTHEGVVVPIRRADPIAPVMTPPLNNVVSDVTEDNKTLSARLPELNTNPTLAEKAHEGPQLKLVSDNPSSPSPRSLEDIVGKHQFSVSRERVWKMPLLYVIKGAKDNGVIDEENNIVTLAASTFGEVSVIVIGPSGLGKSTIIEGWTKLLPQGSTYTMIHKTNSALAKDEVAINQAGIIYIYEAKNFLYPSNTNENYKAVLCLADGQDYTKEISGQGEQHDVGSPNVTRFKINGNKSIITSEATESYLKLGIEVLSRFVELRVDMSEEHIERAHIGGESKDRFYSCSTILSSSEQEVLREHLNDCLCVKGAKTIPSFEVEAMMALIPKGPRSGRYRKRLFRMIYGSMILHHKDRLFHEGIMYQEMQDVYNVLSAYYPTLCKTIRGYPIYGDVIMKAIQQFVAEHPQQEPQRAEGTENQDVKPLYFTSGDIFERVRNPDSPFNFNYLLVKNTLEGMFVAQYLEKSDIAESKNPLYTLPAASHCEHSFDWKNIFEQAFARVRIRDPHLADSWREKQIVGGAVTVYHPFTGEQKTLFNL